MRRRAWIATTAPPPASTALASSFDRGSSSAVIGHLYCRDLCTSDRGAGGRGAGRPPTRGPPKPPPGGGPPAPRGPAPPLRAVPPPRRRPAAPPPLARRGHVPSRARKPPR